MSEPKAAETLGFELARMIGSRKCSKVVVDSISVLCGGNLAFIDGVELAQLQTFLPSAVAKSVWAEVSKHLNGLNPKTRSIVGTGPFHPVPEPNDFLQGLLVPQVHVFSLQDALKIFTVSGRAVCVSEATTMSPTTALFTAIAKAEDKLCAQADEDSDQKVLDIMNGASSTPTNTTVALNCEAHQVELIQFLMRFINFSACSYLYRKYPGAQWSFTQAGGPYGSQAYLKANTDAIFTVLTQSMSGDLVQESSTVQVFQKHVPFADFHSAFLDGIFKSFGLGDSELKQLDEILTNITKDLLNLNLQEGSASESVDHQLFTFYAEPVQGFTSIKQTKLRLFYMHIDYDSWVRVVNQKKSSDSTTMIDFNMTITDATFNMMWMPSDDTFHKAQRMLDKMTASETDATKNRLKVQCVDAKN